MEPGAEFAGYRIERVLGAGGMGVVYLAQHPRLSRRVALKVISAAASADESFRARFQREAQVVAELAHPNIVDVYDTGDEGGVLWLSMPYVEGRNVAQLIAVTGPMPPLQVVEVGRQIASALDYAHSRGVLHRDVKPANILLDAQHGTALLADFGIARTDAPDAALTATGFALGTPDYSSPEQLAARPLTGATDVYSLAATLFCMLTGSPPFGDVTAAEKIGAHLHVPPPRASQRAPGLPAVVDDVLARGMAKDPAARPSSAAELVSELDGVLGATAVIRAPALGGTAAAGDATQIIGRSGPVPQPASPPKSRTRLWVALAVAAVVVLVAGGVGGYFLLRSSPDSGKAHGGAGNVAEQACRDARDAAGNAMAEALTVDLSDMDGWRSRVDRVMTGQALEQMTQQMAALEDLLRAGSGGKVTTTVTATGLQRCSGGEAAVLVVTSSQAQSAGQDEQTTPLEFAVVVTDDDGTWKANEVTPLVLVPSSGGEDSAGPPSSGGATEAAVLPVPCGDLPVAAAYDAAVAVFSFDYRDLDEQQVSARKTLTGEALEEFEDNADAARTQIVTGKVESRAVTSADAAGVAECAPGKATILMVIEVGQTVNGTGTGATAVPILLDVVESGGVWKVARIRDVTTESGAG